MNNPQENRKTRHNNCSCFHLYNLITNDNDNNVVNRSILTLRNLIKIIPPHKTSPEPQQAKTPKQPPVRFH
jgi:hypothetical protein